MFAEKHNNCMGHFQSVGSADGDVSSALLLWSNDSLERPTLQFSGESRYLIPLWVSRIGEPRQEFHQDTLLHQELKDKITTVLKGLTFRKDHVLFQFWLPRVDGNQQLLSTVDQPFGLGVVDEQLCSYRRYSVDNGHEAEDGSPPARVFRQGLPEWTADVTNYLPQDFPQQAVAIHCNLHGYLALPVFDSTTGSGICVGVLELLTGSKYMSYDYEVQQIHKALKEKNLTCPEPFECRASNVPNERRQNELDKIHNFLKDVCYTNNLLFAQTWALSPHGSYVSHEKMLVKSCSSFDTRCVGKVCMSTAGLPFHVQDSGMWSFYEACRDRHLEMSQGVAGRALSSRGSCFCGNITKLSEEEYPLVHYARINGLTSCFAIFLHSVEGNDGYVLEFFLPSVMEDGISVLDVVQTLKLDIEAAFGFELGDSSSVQVVGIPREVISLSLNADPHSIEISSAATTNTMIFELVSSDSESVVANVTTADSANIKNQWSSKQNYPSKSNVSRSTLKRFCREHDMPSWPYSKQKKRATKVTDLKLLTTWSNDNLQRSSNLHFGISSLVFLLIRVKRWRNKCSVRKALQNRDHPAVSESTENLKYKAKIIDTYSHVDWQVLEYNRVHASPRKTVANGLLETVNPLGIYEAVLLVIGLKRWRKTTVVTNAIPCNNCLVDKQVSDSFMTFHASPKKNAGYVSDTRMVTVKATFKDDIIKFKFPTASSLLELENEVAQRIKLDSRKFRLKYRDEDNVMILLACDADLNNLLGFSTSNSLIKLIIVSAFD